ncbi:MAG: type IX secretion system sortase PorU [Flavobacteriales bacterium]|nr:type IX secretion system sortase PorU [Flavobacteriales bacterium]
MTFRKLKTLLFAAIFFLALPHSIAQTQHVKINWKSTTEQFPGDFEQAQIQYLNNGEYYPIWVSSEKTQDQKFDVAMTNPVYEKLNVDASKFLFLNSIRSVEFLNGEERGSNRLLVKVVPFRITGSIVERLVEFDLTRKASGMVEKRFNKKGNKTQSVLASGEWYKIKIREDGVYKIDKGFLSKMGINTDEINLNTFKIYGNGIGMLPEVIAEPRVDDLAENAIRINDPNGNGKLDEGDFILFYAKGPDDWEPGLTEYTHRKNVYSAFSYYFITWGGNNGIRMGQNGDGNGAGVDKVITESDYLYLHEEDLINFRNSGREWFGEALTLENAKFQVSIPDMLASGFNKLVSETAIRTGVQTNIIVSMNGGQFLIHSGSRVNFDADDNWASISKLKKSLNPGTTFNLEYQFIRPQLSSEAWLNYFEIQVKRKMKPIDGQIHLFNLDAKIKGKVKFQIEGLTSDYQLWDVTDPTLVSEQQTFNESGLSSFIVNPNDKLNRYLVFKAGSEKTPEAAGKVKNQNLHSLAPADFIIITHPNFKNQAEKLGKFHQDRDGYSYLIAYPEDIYNEFSSGALDITAIRDFVKMIYDRADPSSKPKALLLFGDASFDYRNIQNGNNNFVPTMESYEYNNSVSSYCSDDYFVILGDFEGYWPKLTIQELLDMGVGRLTANSEYEAEVMVDKCIHYKTFSDKGNWRSSITFLADDEDGDVHFEDSEILSETAEKQFSPLNVNKIYFDAYKQVSLGNGNAYPDVNEAINNSIENGTLVFNYLGHGGGSGMGHERVVTRPMILGWRNYDKLTFFVTGTCDLAQFDNPKEESPGELMMLNNEGGAIGMMTTTRKVYIGLNTSFSENLFKNNLFAKDGNRYTSFGQAYANVKSIMWGSDNVRNYIMIGDPLMDLNLPVEKTVITSINGNPVSTTSTDTLKALSKVEIGGMVTDNSGVPMTDFNGTVNVTLFDKKQTYKTLANDPGSSVLPFQVRNNVLYRGKASVVSGEFKVSFILPKDIDYSFGKGRIFTYAYNDKTDAVGIYDSVVIGGSFLTGTVDETGPQIQVFMDDEKFVNGGIVSSSPYLIVKLWDENGINTAGSGVGRELLATLDKGSEGSKDYILNDFYSTTLNSFQGGEVKIKLSEISPGEHNIIVRAWDVFNNSSESSVEFLVSNNENLTLKNLLNYPNPFVNKTKIFFDHNKAGQQLNVVVNIMSVSGRVVKSLYADIPNAASHIEEIEWDGKDEFGDNLGRGVYIYKVKVKSEDGKVVEELQKMVLLK